MMEPNAPNAAVQNMNSEPGQVATDCLRVSVILRTILQHFSTAELLQLALVNKFWSYEAGTLLRDRGSLALGINRKTRSCQDLRSLASALRRTKVITRVLPFSGLTINLNGLDCSHTDWCRGFSSKELSQVCDEILGQMTWKSLSVIFGRNWTEEFINCPGFVLVKKLLEKFGSVLEVITLRFPAERGDILQQVFQSSSYPRLAILRIERSNAPNEGYTNWVKTIVSRAPNLKLFETHNYVDLNANLLEGSSAAHVTSYPFSPFLDEVPESSVGKFRMTRMDLTEIIPDFQLDKFNRITSGLLEVSRPTLSSMHIDIMFLVPLATYGVCLENVRILEINLNQPDNVVDPQPDLWRLAKAFDFTRIFPNLKDVRISLLSGFLYNLDGISEMVERGNASFVEPLPDRAVKIKNLNVECSWEIRDSGVQLLAEMFPAVEQLSIQATEIPFGCIWESWPDLKSLDVNDVPMNSVVKNLDSVFCGIFPEEVAQLREQDEEYLKKVNIVPIMPSITCLKDLKTLNFIFGDTSLGRVSDPTYLFSKVTGLIAFQRCPGLAVALITNDGRALDHLRPYATILLEY